ncbi:MULTISPECIES: HMA2 domain-containing protein [Shewanella]|uniref:Uncharacterized protein n=1 Tax=Shewanella fidelis TaxID=173509 RepID=A0AAW8NKC1_9GAMM|nr:MULTISPECIES: cation transporter [Shewanella]MDR8522348.1 hypothetical protein [Shewanella fidelis]MDW4812436.1 hypothetical protein [Shewanella fidelis]MDW4816183.1 hypothetical protein [Shewanella fidelis]MDW4820677.1 hypothetical protein [Shewanella fidelis]MDW4824899.1 hypothetical protein [Shewanella fidelis]
MRRWVEIAHHIPGRIRLKYKVGLMAQLMQYSLKDVDDVVAQIPAFLSYKLNKSTGSIVIEYNPELVSAAVINDLFGESDEQATDAYHLLAEYLQAEGITQ